MSAASIVAPPVPSPASATMPAASDPPPRRRRGRPPGSGRTPGQTRGRATSALDALPGVDPAVLSRTRLVAAVILDVLTGTRSTTDAAQALGVSVARYYALEHQAVRGLVRACAPRPRGRPEASDDPVRERDRLAAENRRLTQALLRQQALVRAGQRSLGVPAPASPPGRSPAAARGGPAGVVAARRRRARHPSVRALRAARTLHAAAAPVAPVVPCAPASNTTSPDRRGG